MECPFCKKETLIDGTLEAVAFQPNKKIKKLTFLGKPAGIYGIKASLCTFCGKLSQLHIDTSVLVQFGIKTNE